MWFLIESKLTLSASGYTGFNTYATGSAMVPYQVETKFFLLTPDTLSFINMRLDPLLLYGYGTNPGAIFLQY